MFNYSSYLGYIMKARRESRDHPESVSVSSWIMGLWTYQAYCVTERWPILTVSAVSCSSQWTDRRGYGVHQWGRDVDN